MPKSWRITKAKHAATAFDGEGARKSGGRWNSPGLALVYTSSTASLAALEIVVNVQGSDLLASYVVFSCEFREDLIEPVDLSKLPPNWRNSPIPPQTQAFGDEWLRSGRSAILEVPSAVVDLEHNYLFNPLHPDFGNVIISGPWKFGFDPRLTGR
jgi:RES domain-containing protein